MYLIEKCFGNEYAHQLIQKDWKDQEEVLFKFLKNFIEINEVIIEITINKQMTQEDQSEEAKNYKDYLFKYLELMCDMYKKDQQGVTQEVIE